MFGAALLLSALVAGQPVAAAPSLPDSDPAARIAVGAFAFGCFEQLSFATDAADYAAKSKTLGAQLRAQASDLSDNFNFEGVGGDSCRVTYRGPNAARLWSALTDFRANKANNPCAEQHPSADRAVLVCAASANPAYTETVERHGSGSTGQLVASLTFRGRAAPGGSSAVIPPR